MDINSNNITSVSFHFSRLEPRYYRELQDIMSKNNFNKEQPTYYMGTLKNLVNALSELLAMDWLKRHAKSIIVKYKGKVYEISKILNRFNSLFVFIGTDQEVDKYITEELFVN